jgi:hypothetical protein
MQLMCSAPHPLPWALLLTSGRWPAPSAALPQSTTAAAVVPAAACCTGGYWRPWPVAQLKLAGCRLMLAP